MPILGNNNLKKIYVNEKKGNEKRNTHLLSQALLFLHFKASIDYYSGLVVWQLNPGCGWTGRSPLAADAPHLWNVKAWFPIKISISWSNRLHRLDCKRSWVWRVQSAVIFISLLTVMGGGLWWGVGVSPGTKIWCPIRFRNSDKELMPN